jgi:hypothetical protein
MTANTQEKRYLKFAGLDEAVTYCRSMGYGYEVSYPHFRYVKKKSTIFQNKFTI